MKNKYFTLLLIAFFGLSLTQSTNNDCDTFFPISKGSSWTYQDFDKKGKLSGTQKTTVLDVVQSGNKTEFELSNSYTDAKAKNVEDTAENTFHYVCENGVLKMDMSTMIPQETTEGFKDMDISIEQDELVIPSSISVGETLNDAFIQMNASSNGMKIMTMTVKVSNRKVEKKESITTDAGTFDCFLLTYDVQTKMGFMNVQSSGKDWYSDQVGIVKSETYDKNQKLASSRVLTAYTK